MPLQACEALQSQLTNAEATNDDLVGEVEVKQAELRGKQAKLDTAAVEATRLQARFEVQGQQLTQRSEQAEALQKSLQESADAQKAFSKVPMSHAHRI